MGILKIISHGPFALGIGVHHAGAVLGVRPKVAVPIIVSGVTDDLFRTVQGLLLGDLAVLVALIIYIQDTYHILYGSLNFRVESLLDFRDIVTVSIAHFHERQAPDDKRGSDEQKRDQ
ncbi:hypothetical protein SDC9_209488 [bioreactor metagenome]|uniref:Uncharacterized protein n=1 Tax=bioreactor metagenome TaxID=1076179 RepID=A0A645JE61_9ZZZZ